MKVYKIIGIFSTIVFCSLFLLISPSKTYATSVSVTGKAKVLNTGNSYLNFTLYNSNVTVDDGSGNFSGYAWLEDMGWVAFGTTDNSLGPVNLNLTTGVVTGKAKVLNTDAYLDFASYSSNVTVALTTGVFSGYVFSEDVGWINFSDTGVSSASPFLPTAPSGLSGTADSTTAITWNWTDNSSNETGFRVDDSSNNDKSGNLAAGTTSWQETGLSPNTFYTRHVHAFNTAGDGTASGIASKITLSTAPTGSSITGSQAISAWTNNSSFVFTNTPNFGAGSVQYFRYVWDTSSTHTWTGSETQWTSGTLTKTATSDSNSWYLHLKGYNSADVANGTVDLGPYYYDGTAPVSFDLNSPGHESYTNSERPSFKWKATTDATSGLSKYKLEIDNGDSGDFTIDDIPTSRTTDYSTNKYQIHYENFDDSDSTNNYISVYTKSSSDWSSSENDGKLKEGKRYWKVKAVDNAGNEREESRTLYVDFTNPTLTSVSLDNIGVKDGFLVVTTTKPKITGTISDNLMPDKIILSFYKQNFFLGIETSSELVLSEKNTLTNSNSATSLTFSLSPSQDIEYGKYQVIVKGMDKAGNGSVEQTLNIQIMTDSQAKTLLPELNKEDLEKIREKSQISLPELEKKALLRREKEASEFKKLTQGFSDQINVIASVIKQALSSILTFVRDSSSFALAVAGEGVHNIASAIFNTFTYVITSTSTVIIGASEAVSKQIQIATSSIGNGFLAITNTIGRLYINLAQKAPGIVKNMMLAVKNGVNTVSSAIVQINKLALNTLNKSLADLEDKISKTSKETTNLVAGVANGVVAFTTSTVKSTADLLASANTQLTNSQKEIREQIAQTHQKTSDTIKDKGQRISRGISLAFRSFQKPVNNTADFLDRTKVWFLTFESVVLDPNPTSISDITIEELDKDYAVVSWKTNHYAWGKVNYGEDLTYGEEVTLLKREKEHKVRLTNLKPGTRYYFEVMSQNKNYAYDAYYSFETKK